MATLPAKIIGVAIWYDGITYFLPKPNRHHDVIKYIKQLTGSGIAGPDVQGFYDADHNFQTRETALSIAIQNCQLITKTQPTDKLFSEDLW